MDGQTCYYVIVEAGPAGCVLAARLSADPSVRVALVEVSPGGRAGAWKSRSSAWR